MSAGDVSLPVQRDIVRAIRGHGGRATLGDLMAATSRPSADIEANVLPALNGVGGHLAVDDNGELIYSVQGPRKLPADPWIYRLGRLVREAFKAIFFAGLTVVLVGYFAFYVLLALALAVAAIAAASRGGDCDCDCDCGGCEGCEGCAECAGCCDSVSFNACGDSLAGCFACGGPANKARVKARNADRRGRSRERKQARRAQRSQRRQRRTARRHDTLVALRSSMGLTGEPAHLGMALSREVVSTKPPFLRAVRDYIFGPPRPLPDPLAMERNALAFIRAHDGRVAASDMVMLTGLSLSAADAVLLDIATRYAGDIEVSEQGTILYTFDRLLVSTSGDTSPLDWIAQQQHATTVETFARREGVDAPTALARLQHLASVAGGQVEHGATTRFVFPSDAREQLDAWSTQAGGVRDYVYCWEELELSPAVIGLPPDERGWVVGFNLANLVLGLLLLANVDLIEELLGVDFSGGAAWAVGYVPLAFSASVFLIPAIRNVARAIGDRGRRRRNAHRVVLLALFHALEGDDAKVTAHELSETLFGVARFRQFPHLESELRRLAAELQGSIDTEAPLSDRGLTYTFERVFDELHAVHHARLTVDLGALQLAKIVYDTSREDAEDMELDQQIEEL